MKYNKLVRDKIPEYIKSKGGVPVVHIADDTEYWGKLLEKLSEEVDEFKKDQNAEEFVDILEVIDAITNYKKFNGQELKEIKEKKLKERGGFSKQIILEES